MPPTSKPARLPLALKYSNFIPYCCAFSLVNHSMEAGVALVMYAIASTEKPSLVKYDPTSALATPDSCLSLERYAAWKPIWVLGYTARCAPASHVSAQAERHLWF